MSFRATPIPWNSRATYNLCISPRGGGGDATRCPAPAQLREPQQVPLRAHQRDQVGVGNLGCLMASP
jgi:hypothetical protein